MKKQIIASVFGLAAMVGVAKADFIPVGVQNDVLLSTVTGAWGWTQIYRDDYSAGGCCDGTGIPLSTMFAGHGDYVMLGGIRDGSDTIDVLAAIAWDDFIIHTAHNTTHLSNGAQWYSNGFSLGFAGAGDTINQTQADTNGLNERDRLSWHTSAGNGFDQNAPATGVFWGWRAGNNTSLNNSTEWDRIIFTMNANPVPGPAVGAGLPGLAMAVGGFLAWRRRKAALAA